MVSLNAQVWKAWMIQSPESLEILEKGKACGISVQYMYGMDISPQDDNYVAIIEDVAGVWRSLGKDEDGNYTWQMSPCRGMAARGGGTVACDPTNKLRWLYTIASANPDTNNPGIYLTEDYFDTATRVFAPGNIGGGGGNDPIEQLGFSYACNNLKFYDGDLVGFINTSGGNTERNSNPSSGGFWLSDNGGRAGSWTRKAEASAVASIGKIWGFSFRPGASTTVYAYGYGGFFRSTNGGETFAKYHGGGTLPNGLVTGLQIDPDTPNNMRVCSYGRGIYETTDGGANWSRRTLSGTSNGSFGRLEGCEVSGAYDQFMVIGINQGVGSGQDSIIVKGSTVSSINPDGDYWGIPHPLNRSWHQQIRIKGYAESTGYVVAKTSFRFSHQNPDQVVGHSRCTFWQNGGTSGTYAAFRNAGIGYNGAGFGQNNMYCLAETPDGEYMAQALYDYHVCVSFDRGRSWYQRSSGNPVPGTFPGGSFGVVISPAKDGRMMSIVGDYYPGNRKFTLTSNYGQNWQVFTGDSYNKFNCLGWNRNRTNYCYNDKYFSRDRGDNWVRWNTAAGGGSAFGCNNTNDAKFLAAAPSNGNVVWAKNANGSQVYRGVLNASLAGQAGEWTWANVHTLGGSTSGIERSQFIDTFWPDWNDDEVFYYYAQGIGLRRVNYNGGNVQVSTYAQVPGNWTPNHLRTDPNDWRTVYLYQRGNTAPQVYAAEDVSQSNPWEDYTANLPVGAYHGTMEVLTTGDVVIGGTGGPFTRQGLGDLTNSKLNLGGDWDDVVQPQAVFLEGGTPDPEPEPPSGDFEELTFTMGNLNGVYYGFDIGTIYGTFGTRSDYGFLGDEFAMFTVQQNSGRVRAIMASGGQIPGVDSFFIWIPGWGSEIEVSWYAPDNRYQTEPIGGLGTYFDGLTAPTILLSPVSFDEATVPAFDGGTLSLTGAEATFTTVGAEELGPGSLSLTGASIQINDGVFIPLPTPTVSTAGADVVFETTGDPVIPGQDDTITITMGSAGEPAIYWGYNDGTSPTAGGNAFGAAIDADWDGNIVKAISVQASGRVRIDHEGGQVPGVDTIYVTFPDFDTIAVPWDGVNGFYSSGLISGLWDYIISEAEPYVVEDYVVADYTDDDWDATMTVGDGLPPPQTGEVPLATGALTLNGSAVNLIYSDTIELDGGTLVTSGADIGVTGLVELEGGTLSLSGATLGTAENTLYFLHTGVILSGADLRILEGAYSPGRGKGRRRKLDLMIRDRP